MKNAYTTKSYIEVIAPWISFCYTGMFGVFGLRQCGLCPGADSRQGYPFLNWGRKKHSDRASPLFILRYLFFCLLLLSLVSGVGAQNPDSTIAPFDSGSGSEEDPFRIATLEQLQAIHDTLYLGKHFIQIADIDALETKHWNEGQGFKPIGENSIFHSFHGTYDGDGYEIRNIIIRREEELYVALFKRTEKATIRNVSLINVDIKGRNGTGGLVASFNRSSIDNCSVSGSVSGSWMVGLLVASSNWESTIRDSYVSGVVSGSVNVGGLVGTNRSFSGIYQSYARANVTGYSQNTGGLAGNNMALIRDSHASGHVKGGGVVGGLTGTNGGNIYDSFTHEGDSVSGNSVVGGLTGNNSGRIHRSRAKGIVTGSNRVGGFAGVTSENSQIRNSFSSGDVEGNDQVGGLAGSNNGLVVDSHASGNVTGNRRVGGLNGYNAGEVRASSATGHVTGFSENIGGLIGYSGGSRAQITRSFATGNVSGSGEAVGGLLGTLFMGSRIEHVYAHGSVEGESKVGGLVGFASIYSHIRYAYSSGPVKGNDEVRGLIGVNEASVIRTFWDVETSGHSCDDEKNPRRVKGLLTDQMTGENAFIYMHDLGFDDVWQLTGTYPVLRWQNSSDSIPPPEVPILQVTPHEDHSYDFGELNVHEADTITILFRNTGKARLDISLTLSGQDDFYFSPEKNVEENISIDIGDSLLVDIIFSPRTTGPLNTTLAIDHNAPNKPDKMTLELTGAGKKVTAGIEEGNLPKVFQLKANYPNPFNPVTVIPFSMAESAEIRIEIFDLLGRRISLLAEGHFDVGRHKVSWNGSEAVSGVYLVRMTVDSHRLLLNRKIMLLK